MSRISIPSIEQTLEAAKPLLAAVQQQLGVVPNLMKLVGRSPAALEGYLSLNSALAKGKLNTQLRESVALTVAEYNGCDYCLSAHSYLALNVAKLGSDEIEAARSGHSRDPRTDAALHFAQRVAETRGHIADTDLATLRSAGFDDAGVIDIVVTVALNTLTNYVNNVAQTDIDFPKISARIAA